MADEPTTDLVRHQFASLGRATCGAHLPMTTVMNDDEVTCCACRAAIGKAELERLRAERDAAVQEMADLRDYHREFCEQERRDVAAARADERERIAREIAAQASCASPPDTCYRDHDGCAGAESLRIARGDKSPAPTEEADRG